MVEAAGGGDTGGGGTGGATTTTDAPCGCATDADCPPGTLCSACACVPECQTSGDCATPFACCDGACTDVEGDAQNCGGCGVVCDLPGASATCFDLECLIAACDEGFADCDGSAENGCEAPAGACLCSPGEVASCYDGPAGTEGVGFCKPGVAECLGGTAWGPCEGQFLPSEEACDGLDSDCDGHDDTWDPDGDGWTLCDGDCCETAACAEHPERVNPGALDYTNGMDDDCDPATPDDDPFPDCTGPALQTPTSSLELAKAMGLCHYTLESPLSLKDKKWGVISLALTLADGSSPPPDDVQTGVLSEYGQNIPPLHGSTLAALSSGTARDEADPGFIHPQNGYTAGQIGNYVAGTQAPIPADFLAANGGAVPSPCFSCSGAGCGTAFDSASLKLRIRAPTNAEAIRFFASFFTAEYPESICTQYDDFFVALLDSQHPDTPPDKNIAVTGPGNPLSVNTGAFLSCAFPSCALGADELIGTGMGGWDGTLVDGGATSWTYIDGAVVPGETIELRLAIWDATDGNIDSLVLLDDLRFRQIGDGPPPSP